MKGSDLHLDLPLTLYEAVLGAKVRTPTLSGAVNLTIPANASSGKSMRLKGKGLPTKTGGHGDLLVKLQIVMPPHGDDELDTADAGLEGNHSVPRTRTGIRLGLSFVNC